MRILVTGGAGFIGSHVVDALIRHGHDVVVIDDLSTGQRAHVNRAARLHRWDIRNPRIARLIERLAPDVIVHVAAQASVSCSMANPVEDGSVNVLGTVNLLDACRRAQIPAFIYISTGGAAYGDTDVVPTPEDHPMRPESFYGTSKVGAERYVDSFRLLTPLRALTLRLANIYGPRQDPAGEAGVVAIFTDRLLHGKPCIINGDGEQTRDFVYVGDVADAVVRALEHPTATGALNIGTGIETTINTIYESLARIVGVQHPAEHGPAKPGEQRRSALAATRAQQVIGWTPVTPLDVGLGITIDNFKARRSTR